MHSGRFNARGQTQLEGDYICSFCRCECAAPRFPVGNHIFCLPECCLLFIQRNKPQLGKQMQLRVSLACKRRVPIPQQFNYDLVHAERRTEVLRVRDMQQLNPTEQARQAQDLSPYHQ